MTGQASTDHRVRALYELSTLVSRFEADRTLPEVVSLTARALPVCSVALVLEERSALRSHLWKAEHLDQSRSDDALAQARRTYGWFTERTSPVSESSVRSRFVALPLIVERGHVFGVLQVEAEGPLTEGDVFFVNAAANLLAMAFDRRLASDNAEARIRAQLQFTRALTECLGEGVLATDTDARITFLNPAAEDLLGWKEQGVLGMHSPDVLCVQRTDGTMLDPTDCPLIRALATDGRICNDDQSFLGRDRVPVPVSYTAAPVRIDGRVCGAVVVFREVLAVKRSERAQRLLASASAALGDSLDYKTTLSALVSCTVPAFADLCFIDEVEPSGSIAHASAPHHAHAVATGRAVLVECVSPTDEGGPHSKRVDASGARSLIVVPLSVRGRAFGVLSFAMAESGRRYTSDDLGLAEELGRRTATAIDNARLHLALQDAVRDRQDILAVVSHDLRSPLNTVSMAAASLLERAPESDRRVSDRRALEMITRAGKRMERMTSDLLDLSSIEAGHLAVSPAPTPVSALVEDVLEAMSVAASARELQLVAASLESALMVQCDRDRILQVLSNLVSNAIKFTPRGGRIDLSAAAGDGFVRFSVSDTGPGISADLVPHVFERYRQAVETASKGRGLGLFITKGIIDAHGGTIGVDSVPGSGTTFFFNLPRVQFAKADYEIA